MNFKLNKTDIYLILTYYALVIPVQCLDYADYEVKMDLFYEVFLFGITDALCVYVVVFVLFPKFFPKKQYIRLIFSTILILLIIGHVWINIYCFFVDSCTGNWFSFKAAYAGLNNIASSFAILGIIVLGKKFFDAQTNFLKMEKEKKESELKRLTSQIDPHFLFNNLNTVDSLIDTNPKVAKIYLHKLSQLYRYLIATKDQEVIELEAEMEFAQNYIYLIQSRFGNSYKFELFKNLPTEPIFIPPGALQTLLENIVKHNQPTVQQPIISKIELLNDTIRISNNLNLKTEVVDSTGTGLNNLKARYQLLIDQEIKITSNGTFIVELPLIRAVD